MPAKVRIYELSKELGIENQVCLKLCQMLNIGGDGGDLKISSSLPVAQAERVRRKAEREGLVEKLARQLPAQPLLRLARLNAANPPLGDPGVRTPDSRGAAQLLGDSRGMAQLLGVRLLGGRGPAKR